MTTFGQKIQFWSQRLGSYRPTTKQITIALGSIMILLIAANGAMAWHYSDRILPNTFIGELAVGGMEKQQARQAAEDHVQRQPVSLAFDKDLVQVGSGELGATYDIEATMSSLNDLTRPALPMLSLLPSSDRRVDFSYELDSEVFEAQVERILKDKNAKPENAMLEIKAGQAKIINETPGRQYEADSVKQQIKNSLANLSPTPVVVDQNVIEPQVSVADLQPAKDQADQKLGTVIMLSYQDESFQPTPEKIGQWLKLNDQNRIEVNEDEVAKYVEELAGKIDQPVINHVVTTMDGAEVDRKTGKSGLALNRQDAIDAIIAALDQNEDLNHQLQAEELEPSEEFIRKFSTRAVTYNYCVVANQVSSSLLSGFSQKITSTLADSRGWGLDGRIAFQEVDSGCSFNLVLAAAHTLPEYSSGCSVYWSCRVGVNVIINVDRWNGGTDAWNNAGGSIDGYRTMVINHEVGHWLGFGHWSCGGPGQQAPVMLQQSISLQGCTFNPWPSQAELDQLRAMKGL